MGFGFRENSGPDTLCNLLLGRYQDGWESKAFLGIRGLLW